MDKYSLFGRSVLKTSRPGTWLCAIMLILAMPSYAGWSLHGRVVAVLDGDTVTLLDAQRTQHRIRLAQIDAPEKSQAFGERSKKSLSELTYNREVEAECFELDRYGRSVCRLRVDGRDINLEQVLRGMAWAYRQYVRETVYFRAEDVARREQRGLWLDPNPVPPWEYRHKAAERR